MLSNELIGPTNTSGNVSIARTKTINPIAVLLENATSKKDIIVESPK